MAKIECSFEVGKWTTLEGIIYFAVDDTFISFDKIFN